MAPPPKKGRARGRPRVPHPDDPFDWLRFLPEYIEGGFADIESNIRVKGGDWREINEEWRKEAAGNAMREHGFEGRTIVNNARVASARHAIDQLAARHGDLIRNRRVSDSAIADCIIARDNLDPRKRRTLRRHIGTVRKLLASK